jgi:hypothetical protein
MAWSLITGGRRERRRDGQRIPQPATPACRDASGDRDLPSLAGRIPCPIITAETFLKALDA